MKALFLALGLAGAVPLHDFFVSILTIRHTPEARTLDLSWRMTAHDIEHALEATPLKLGSDKENPKADSLLNAYFTHQLVLFQEDKQLSWQWVGKELDGETLYCYLQVKDVSSPNGLMVQNTLLQDVFGDQQNLVHVEGEKTPARSHTFIQGSSPHTFTW